MALAEKGVFMGSHYDLSQPPQTTGGGAPADASRPPNASLVQAQTADTQPAEEAQDGVFL